MRVAAIDQGTNTTRLLVADVEDGDARELHRETRITRLGEGVDTRGRLLPVPIARVRNALSDYRRTAESLGAERTLLIATSAVRDAENGEAFLGEIEWSYGFATQLLSGDDEAEMTRRGIGGLGRRDAARRHRRRLDRARARRLQRQPAARLGSLHRARTARRSPRSRPRRTRCSRRSSRREAVGVAGTITTLAALDLGLERYDRERVHGHFLTRDGAERQLERLAAIPLAERRLVPALDPERAPVIVAGAAILVAILDAYDLDGIRASERDILDGAALAAAELPEPEEGAAPPGAYTCC